MKAILNFKANIFIIILPIIKKLRLIIGLPDSSKIIIIV